MVRKKTRLCGKNSQRGGRGLTQTHSIFFSVFSNSGATWEFFPHNPVFFWPLLTYYHLVAFTYMEVAETVLRILCNSALLVEFMSQQWVLPWLRLDKIEACSVFPSLKSSSDAGQKCGQDVHVEVHAHFNGHASPSWALEIRPRWKFCSTPW